MQWQVEWGPHIAKLVLLQRQGMSVPALESAPDLDELLLHVWNAFAQLARSRPYGMNGALPIPVADIDAWLSIHQVRDLETRIEYYELIVAMDNEWLKRDDAHSKEMSAGTRSAHPSGDRRAQSASGRGRG